MNKKPFRRKRSDLHPGWKMTVDQHGKYWRMIGQCCAALGASTAAEREEVRQIIHFRAFKRPDVSAKDIDHLKMFDAFVGECLAILKPNDLNAQLRQASMESIRLIYRINELAPENYWRAEAKRKFGTDDLDTLNVDQLTQFRNHLSARASEIVWPAQPGTAAVSAASEPEETPEEENIFMGGVSSGAITCANCSDSNEPF